MIKVMDRCIDMKQDKNPMTALKVEKVTLNMGAGKDQKKLEKAVKLLKSITGVAPVTTKTEKRIAAWGLRPGLPVGCKITLRKEPAYKLITRLLEAKDNVLKEENFDDSGNISFGIPEYIDIPGVEYDPEIGVIGLQASITLEKPGFRIKKRRIKKGKVGKKHEAAKEEAISYMKDRFKVKVEGEDELQ